MPSIITDRASGLGTGAIPNGENATISQKVPCRVATTANITRSGLQTLDTITVVADDRVLVKDQTDGSQNGIYLASADVWQRTNDCVDAGDLVRGSQVRVNEGASAAGSWYCTSDDPIAIGTDDITWVDVATTVLSGAEIKALYEAEPDTNAFEDADAAKLGSVEPGADVTDTINVTAAGALMESEVDADIKTLSLPANTTISMFGASLIDDTSAASARATLSVERAVTVNVLDQGAVGDGTTNDAAAFSAACTSAGVNGIVIVPGGLTYNLGAQVSITQAGLTMIGVGKPTLLRGANTSPIRIAADRVEVSGLRVDGQKAIFTTSSSCIRIDNVDDWKILNNECFDCTNHGINPDGQTSGCSNGWVVGNKVYNCDGIGIATNTVTNSIIAGNILNNNGLEGITLDVASLANICVFNRVDASCQISGVGGIGFDDAELNVISCNVVTNTANSNSGIKAQNDSGPTQWNALIGNIFSGNSNFGIHFSTNAGQASVENVAMGNVLYNNTSGALKVDPSSINNVMNGNVTSDGSVDVTDQNQTQLEPISFLVTLSSNQNNVTGDGTTYKVPFDTEVRDYGGNFSTSNNEFTAPVTGEYIFYAGARMQGAASDLEWAQIIITTSNRSFRFELHVNAETTFAPNCSQVIDTQAGDIAYLRIRAVATSGLVVDLSNDAQQTFFGGRFLG